MTPAQTVTLKEHITTVVALEVGKVDQKLNLTVGELDRKVDRIDAHLEKLLAHMESQRGDIRSEISTLEARVEKRLISIERAIVPLQAFRVKYGLIFGGLGLIIVPLIAAFLNHLLFGR